MAKIKVFNQKDLEKISKLRLQVENNSKELDQVVDSIIKDYCEELDNQVMDIDECVRDDENPPLAEDLDYFIMNLSTLIYFASSKLEGLGLRDDISKAIWKETYNSVRDGLERGTIDDKNSKAELEAQYEQIVNICYNRAWRMLKAKVENAQELLASLKKVISRRMQEIELTKLGGNN